MKGLCKYCFSSNMDVEVDEHGQTRCVAFCGSNQQ